MRFQYGYTLLERRWLLMSVIFWHIFFPGRSWHTHRASHTKIAPEIGAIRSLIDEDVEQDRYDLEPRFKFEVNA